MDSEAFSITEEAPLPCFINRNFPPVTTGSLKDTSVHIRPH